MGRRRQSIAYLDTHIVVWICAGVFHKISDDAIDIINKSDIYISPMVKLELQYLYEINRVRESADHILQSLYDSIGLSIDDANFLQVVNQSVNQNWTRDPFDRVITAQASIRKSPLITADKAIQQNYHRALG